MVLVDGHNLIGRGLRIPLSREGDGRRRVVERLAAWASSRREPVIVVFDGSRPSSTGARRVGALRIVYASSNRTADEEILRLLEKEPTRSALVVTSDRGLADRARRRGARVEPSEAFWARVRPSRADDVPPEKPEPSEGEVEEWLRVFLQPRRRRRS